MPFPRFALLRAFFLLCPILDAIQTSGSELSLNQRREENNAVDAIRQELDFIVRPNMTQWEQLLIPAPTVVSLLGRMVVLSSKAYVFLTHI